MRFSRVTARLAICMAAVGCASRPKPCTPLRTLEIHAHRGAADRPNNTLTAFRRAVELGADFVELDVQVTKDKRLIVTHDPYLPKPCIDSALVPVDKPVYFHDLTCGQGGAYRCFVPNEPIPLLSEVFRAFKDSGLGFNIEIKYDAAQHPPREEYLELLLKVLDEEKPKRFMVQSFDHQFLKLLRQKRSDIRVSPLLGGGNIDRGVEIAKDLNADTVTPAFSKVTKEHIDRFHAADIRVIPWTVNHLAEAQSLQKMGVDGLITDEATLYKFMMKECPAAAP